MTVVSPTQVSLASCAESFQRTAVFFNVVDGCGQLIPTGDTDMGQNLGTRMSHNNNIVYAPNMWLRIPYVYIYICIFI